jgi:DNA primase small subunit
MEERTRAYLRGRFGDYYRQTERSPPPGASEREWGYIPWTPGTDTTMVRHQSLLDLGDLDDFLARERPRHVYFSAGHYDDPGAGRMSDKGRRGSDLVFDLDADHLPGVPADADYATMLAACKDALQRLLDFLERDFGFTDVTVVFSGSRGYHVHVRDEGVADLSGEARREIVDYVRGVDVAFETLVDTESVAGHGLKNPTDKRTLDPTGGWSRRVHEHVCGVVDELLAVDEDDAIERLQSYDGIGAGRAESALAAMQQNSEAIHAGNVDVHPDFVHLVRRLSEEAVRDGEAPIDEPVTTDVNRLIRLPGSLHGGSGLVVCRVERDALDDFDPLVDAVPAPFTDHEITVEVTDPAAMDGGESAERGVVELGGDSFTFTAGEHSVPEHVGVFMMARGYAEKGKE